MSFRIAHLVKVVTRSSKRPGKIQILLSGIFLSVVLYWAPFHVMVLAGSAETLRVASFNIHYFVPDDEDDDWAERKHAVSRVLQDIDADIVAFQEMETFEGKHYSKRNMQLSWVHDTVEGYETAASGDPKVFPNTQPIIYRVQQYTVIDQGFFFFSETPDRIYSKQWDGGFPYYCSWARFRSRHSKRDFYVFNVHNDYRSWENRLRTSRLIVDRIEMLVAEDLPIVVLGDFNALKGFKEISLLEQAGLHLIPPGGATNRIFGMHLLPAIDHILVSKHFQPQSNVKVWRNRYDGVYPADHYPISVELIY